MKKILTFLFVVGLLLTFRAGEINAQERCLVTQGEALIVKGDVPAARMEALARAKWAAIEQVVGTAIKAQSFVENFMLVDEVIKTQIGGVVKKYDVLAEERKGENLNVKVRACVEPLKAQEAVSQVSLNNSVALMIPARKPGKGQEEYEETNILSETILNKIIEQGYRAIDVTPTHTVEAREIEEALKSGSTLLVRNLIYKFLSNIIIIGKVDYHLSTKKGEDIGYGLAMPFNNVTVRLSFRIVAKNENTGNVEILFAGVEEAKAMASSLEDAAAKALFQLAERVTPRILDQLAHFTQRNTKNIRVKINGVSDGETTLEIKRMLQGIVWVSEVRETGPGEYMVKYSENSLYLANSIQQKGDFTLNSFSPYSLTFSLATK